MVLLAFDAEQPFKAEGEPSRQKQSGEAGSELQTAEEMQDTMPLFPGSLALLLFFLIALLG